MLDIINKLSEIPSALPLSYSKVSTLFNCPFMYQERYIRHTAPGEVPNPEAAKVRSVLHKVLELCIDKGMSYGWSMEAINFDATWKMVLPPYTLTEKELTMVEAQYEQTKNIFARLVDAINKNRFTVFNEMKICMDKNGRVTSGIKSNNRFFYGFVDFYAETPQRKRALMLDFKSHYCTESNYKKTQEQLGTYTYYLFERNPRLETIQFGGVYLPEEKIDLHPQIFRNSTEHLTIKTDLQTRYMAMLQKLNEGVFEPRKSEYCDWCPFTALCPLINS
jgi:hypothetical protein